jgi:hypothetical protein
MFTNTQNIRDPLQSPSTPTNKEFSIIEKTPKSQQDIECPELPQCQTNPKLTTATPNNQQYQKGNSQFQSPPTHSALASHRINDTSLT